MNSKQEAREEMKKIRAAISMIEMAELSARIAEHVLALPEYDKAKTVLCYANIRDEVMTGALIKEILRSGRRLALPVVVGPEMKAVRLRDISMTHRGPFGITEPDGDEEIPPEELDMVLVPGLGFDMQGTRLGYGAGYYDKYLKKCRCVRVGVGYSVQVVPTLPQEGHDEKMNIVVTEKETYRIGESK